MIDNPFDNNDSEQPKRKNSFLDGLFEDLEAIDKQGEDGEDDDLGGLIIDEPTLIIDEPEEDFINPVVEDVFEDDYDRIVNDVHQEVIIDDNNSIANDVNPEAVIDDNDSINFMDDWFENVDNKEDKVEAVDEEDDDAIERMVNTVQGNILGTSTEKPEPLFPFKQDKKKASLDITKNSKEDHRHPKRYTKKELENQLRNDYRYMLGKKNMVIRPLVVLDEYPYKKKKSDSDIIDDDNVEYDYAMVIGKLLKWKNTEQFRKKPYKIGEIMYVKRGVYWVDGKEVSMKPHFAIKIHKSYKRIKSKRIRDLLAPLKQRLRPGKPFTIYKEFPILIKRTATFS